MKLITKSLLIMLFLVTSVTSFAATPSPLDQVQSVTNQVLAQLKSQKVDMKNNPEVVYKIIRTYLLPRVDTDMMSKSVLGRSAWEKATPAQQKEFITQFTTLMTYTYSSAMAKYDDQTIKYFPIRGGYEGRTLIMVNTQIIRKEGPPINMTYNLILHGAQWQVYDISVEGVSLLASFREQFSNMLSNEGMDALVKNLASHNAEIAKKNKAAVNE